VSIRRNRPLRGAIVGFGNVAVEGHLPTWTADRHFAIHAVCDADPTRLAHAEEVLPSARRYAVLEEMLEHERLDFVDVATPPASHPSIVQAVVEQNVHVLCEKPLALTTDACNKIRTASSQAGVVVFTVHNWKYAPIIRTAKRVLRRGELGKLTELRLETLRTTPPGGAADADWRLDPNVAGGGIFVDHGWHALYLALHLLDASPMAITARLSQRKFTSGTTEDTAECTIEFPGAVATIFLTWAAEARSNTGSITGARGSLTIADRTLTVSCPGREPTETAFAEPLSAGSYHPEWFAAMVEDFREELLEPETRGHNFLEAETTSRLIELGYRSHSAGGVRIPFDEPLPPAEPSGD